MLRTIAVAAGASAVAAHGGMTTPLPRNSFNQPLDPSQPAVFGDMTNYYDVSVALPGPPVPAAPLSRPSVRVSGSLLRTSLLRTSLNAVRARTAACPAATSASTTA